MPASLLIRTKRYKVEMETPVKKKKRGISPIWILPAVALVIGAWLLYKGIVQRPITVIVHFHSAEGITAGKTKVMYKGLPIGYVKEISVDKGMDSVSVILAMSPKTKEGLVTDVKFWIVRPEITAGRISGLETLLSGSYIAVLPGISKIPCREFQGLDAPPPVPENAPGLHIKLRTDALNSIQRGSLIYYRDVNVGSVQDYVMENGGGIIIDAYIEPEYKNLVKPGSRFWNASGITLSGGLSGIKFHMESLSTLVSGGISFYTPETLDHQLPAENGHVFKLYKDYDAAKYGIKVLLKMETGEDMVEGLTKVIYRGLEVGRIKKVRINDNDKKYKVTAELLIDPAAERILRKGTKFWVIRPRVGLGGIQNIGALVSGPYITFVPGEGPPCFEFKVQGSHSKEILKSGTFYRLATSDLSSLEPGAPILFKHVRVGEIASYRLNPDNSVDIVFIIYDQYVRLINRKCVFWNYSGMNMEVTPSKVEINTGSLRSIMTGGVAFDFPRKLYGKKLKPVKQGYRFKLFNSFDDAVKHVPGLKPGVTFVKLVSKGPVSIRDGSPVFYKNVEIGQITQVNLDGKHDRIVVTAFLKNRFLKLINNSTRFYVTSGVNVKGSIRTGLEVQSAPLASIMMGAVSFMNPESKTAGKSGKNRGRIKRNQTFKLYKSLKDALAADYVPVTIHFPDAQDLAVNSKIKHHGIDIGYVQKVSLEKNMKTFLVKALVEKDAAGLFTTGAMVWVVKPEISIRGIKNLGTVVTGPYINVQRGPGSRTTDITGLASPPLIQKTLRGLDIVVEADTLGSLRRGCPVYYRRVRIGTITGYRLAPDARGVWIYLNIEDRFTPLIRKNTHFWNASGIRVDAGLFSGIDVKTETVEAIIAGGIALATPEGDEMGPVVSGGHHFRLYDQPEDKWLKWKPAISLKGQDHRGYPANMAHRPHGFGR